MRICLMAVILLLASAGTALAQEDTLGELPRHVALEGKVHSSGQPSAETIGKLRSAGIRTIIDLRPDKETPNLDEQAVAASAGLDYHALPVSGAADLTPENVSRFDQLLKQSRDDGVLVHCASGNRVGALMALRARWVEGKSADDALAIGKQAGMTGLAGEVERLLRSEAGAPGQP